MKKKKTIVWIILILITAGVIYYFAKPKEESVEYVTATTIVTDVIQTVSVTGGITPVNKANLSFEGSGTIEDIYVEVGDEVEQDNKIARIDDSVMQSQLNEAFLELEKQQEILRQTRRIWDELSPEEKATAKLTEEKARAAVWTLQNQMKKTTLYSPIDGVVIKKYFNVGELVTMTSPVVTIMGDGGLEIKAEIPESDIAKVEVGQKAEVTFDAFSSDEIFEVSISEIEPAATIIQDVVYYEVTFDISTNDSRFKAGMSADIDIATAKKTNVLAIPNQAVKNDNGSKYVEILIIENEEEKVEKINITTGLRGDDGMIEVKSGLKEGDEVVTFTREK